MMRTVRAGDLDHRPRVGSVVAVGVLEQHAVVHAIVVDHARMAAEAPDLGPGGPAVLLHKTSLWIGRVTGSREMFGRVATSDVFTQPTLQFWVASGAAEPSALPRRSEMWMPLHPEQPAGVQPPTATSRDSLTKATFGQ